MPWVALLLLAWGSAMPASFPPATLGFDQPHEAFRLSLPLACRLGETCWIANYVDVDPSDAFKDFRCHTRTYNTHDGTDFAIRDLAVMEQGVPVVASAPGVVRRIRDGMEDQPLTDKASRARIVGRECGNGVVIEHEGGWQTQYCHLRRGSVQVKVGERTAGKARFALRGGEAAAEQLGITVRNLTPELASRLGYSEDETGVVVTAVEPGSLAYRVGIRTGDLIVQVAGEPIKNVDDFERAMAKHDLVKGVRMLVKSGGIMRYVFLRVSK